MLNKRLENILFEHVEEIQSSESPVKEFRHQIQLAGLNRELAGLEDALAEEIKRRKVLLKLQKEGCKRT